MPNSLSAFDLDHTLLDVNCSFHFGKYLYAQNQLSTCQMLYLAGCYAAHAAALISVSKLHQLVFGSLFKGASARFYKQTAAAFLNQQLQSLINQPLFDALVKAKAAGHYTAILSSSPDFLVQAIAEQLDVPHFSSTVYHVDQMGFFSHVGTVMLGCEKATVLRRLANELQVSKENIYAYSDSHLDLAFMEAAGHAVAVRPNRRLRQISLRNGWTILP